MIRYAVECGHAEVGGRYWESGHAAGCCEARAVCFTQLPLTLAENFAAVLERGKWEREAAHKALGAAFVSDG